jgi:hypothetical protein
LSCTLSWKCKCDLPKSFGIRNFWLTPVRRIR